MTAYIEGSTRAHLAEWGPGADGWRPICRLKWRQEPVRHADYPNGDGWPLRHVWDGQPSVPWCSWCIQILQHRIDGFVADVLGPAAVRGEQP